MSYNGSGVFNINTAGQPVVTGTVISSSVFNALTADLATGLSTAITKDGQTTVTANIGFNGYKITNLGAGTASTDAARVGQLQAGAATVITVTGTDTYTGTMAPALAGYAAGNMFSFIVPNTNTSSCTLNIDGQGAKSITRDGSTALVAGDLVSGSEVVVIYDGTRFQVLNSNSKTNFNLSGTLTVAGNVTLSGGTANGVVYLNGSKVATTGSALTFDGSLLAVAGSVQLNNSAPLKWKNASGTSRGILQLYSDNNVYLDADDGVQIYRIGGYEQARLTSTGLGIGTSSPTSKLTIGTGSFGNAGAGTTGLYTDSSAGLVVASDGLYYATRTGVLRMQLDTSGNLGLGVTPSAWVTNRKVMQVGGLASAAIALNGSSAVSEIYFNSYLNTSAVNTYAANGYAGLIDFNSGIAGGFVWKLAASGTAGNPITFTSAMTLDASGRLGIGTTSPTADLSIGDTSTTSSRQIRLHGPSSGTAGGASINVVNATDTIFAAGNASNIIGGSYSSDAMVFWGNAALRFYGNSAERMRLDSSGNLLVGTTNAAENAGSGMKVINTGGTVALVSTASDSSQQGFEMYSTTAGAYRLYINYAGTINATNTTISAISDQRLKENIQDIDVGLDAIMSLKPRKFDWKAGKGKDIKNDRGWIAQEFEEVFPDMIDEWRDPAPEGEEPYKSVRADLIPILVKAIQELTARVAQLEGK